MTKYNVEQREQLLNGTVETLLSMNKESNARVEYKSGGVDNRCIRLYGDTPLTRCEVWISATGKTDVYVGLECNEKLVNGFAGIATLERKQSKKEVCFKFDNVDDALKAFAIAYGIDTEKATQKKATRKKATSRKTKKESASA